MKLEYKAFISAGFQLHHSSVFLRIGKHAKGVRPPMIGHSLSWMEECKLRLADTCWIWSHTWLNAGALVTMSLRLADLDLPVSDRCLVSPLWRFWSSGPIVW